MDKKINRIVDNALDWLMRNGFIYSLHATESRSIVDIRLHEINRTFISSKVMPNNYIKITTLSNREIISPIDDLDVNIFIKMLIQEFKELRNKIGLNKQCIDTYAIINDSLGISRHKIIEAYYLCLTNKRNPEDLVTKEHYYMFEQNFLSLINFKDRTLLTKDNMRINL